MNINNLYYFHCIAAAGSITAAAKLLGLSQPSLSTQLRAFEMCLSALSIFYHWIWFYRVQTFGYDKKQICFWRGD